MATAIVSPTAYSYIRFSTSQQAEGDSLRRQTEAAKEWCDKNNTKLDESTTFHDLGKSAYDENRDLAALDAFLEMAKARKIPRGSFLIVESLDRITRQNQMSAVNLITGICLMGIRIVQLKPSEIIYDEKANLGDIITMIVELSRANSESTMKSERVSRARDNARQLARENGRILTRRAPAWLKVRDGKFQVIPEAVRAIEFLFQWKLEGIGLPTIERKLNEQSSWSPNTGWRQSYIRKILRNIAVIGLYQPCKGVNKKGRKRVPHGDPIPNYFPIVVKPELFHAVQGQLTTNKRKGGQTGTCLNLFTFLTKCGYCGSSMALEDRYNSGPNARWRYLMCDAGRRNLTKRVNEQDPDSPKIPVCKRHTIRLDELESTILDSCTKLKPEQILPNSNEQAKQAEALRIVIAGKEVEFQAIDGQINNLIDQIANSSSASIRDRYEQKVTELEARKVSLKLEIEEATKAFKDASVSNESFATWQEQMIALRQELNEGNVEIRMKTRNHLRQIIERIDVFGSGYPLEEATDYAEFVEESIREENPSFEPDKDFKAFCKWTSEEMQTRRAKFLRVKFRGASEPVDLVPEGSIAMGCRLHKGGIEFITPKVSELWKTWEFESFAQR